MPQLADSRARGAPRRTGGRPPRLLAHRSLPIASGPERTRRLATRDRWATPRSIHVPAVCWRQRGRRGRWENAIGHEGGSFPRRAARMPVGRSRPDIPDRGHSRVHQVHGPARRRGGVTPRRHLRRDRPGGRRGVDGELVGAPRRRGPRRLRLRRARPCAVLDRAPGRARRRDASATRSLPLTVGIGLDAGEAVPVGDGDRGAALNMAARRAPRPLRRDHRERDSSTQRAEHAGLAIPGVAC